MISKLRLGILTVSLLAGLAPAAEKKTTASDQLKRILDDAEFRQGLTEYHMTELLRAYIKTAPAADPIAQIEDRARLLMLEYANPRIKDRARKQKALIQSIALRQKLIDKHLKDPRSVQWLETVGRDILLEQARLLLFTVEFLHPTPKEIDGLKRLMNQTVKTFSQCLDRIGKRLKEMVDDPNFARDYQITGIYEKLKKRRGPVGYWLALARYNLALVLPADAKTASGKPRREQLLTESLDAMQTWAGKPATTGVKWEASLIAAKCKRELGRIKEAIKDLDQLDKVKSLSDRFRFRLRFARVKAIARPGGEANKTALAEAGKLHDWLVKTPFGRGPQFRYAVAILRSGLLMEQAEAARKSGDNNNFDRLRNQSLGVLGALVGKVPSLRDVVYRRLAAHLNKNTTPEQTKPLADMEVMALAYVSQQSAAAALKEKDSDRAKKDYQRAINFYDVVLARKDPTAREMYPEALYYSAAARYKMGGVENYINAADRWTRLARQFPAYPHSLGGAVYAVRILTNFHRQLTAKKATGPLRLKVDTAYLKALEALVLKYPKSKAAIKWNYYLAEMYWQVGQLEGKPGMFIQAAGRYGLVHKGHEHYWDARYRQGYWLRKALDAATTEERKTAQFRQLAQKAYDMLLKFSTDVRDQDAPPPDRLSASASANVQAAEVALNHLNAPRSALETLRDFEKTYPKEKGEFGQALLVRINAYRKRNQPQQAEKVVDDLLRADPERAGPVLQGLIDALDGEINKLMNVDVRIARKRAEDRANLSKKMLQWAKTQPDQKENVHFFNLQYAIALTQSGRYKQAMTELETLLKVNKDDSLALMNKAICLFHQSKFQDANKIFAKLWRNMTPDRREFWIVRLYTLKGAQKLNKPTETICQQIRLAMEKPDLKKFPDVLTQFRNFATQLGCAF